MTTSWRCTPGAGGDAVRTVCNYALFRHSADGSRAHDWYAVCYTATPCPSATTPAVGRRGSLRWGVFHPRCRCAAHFAGGGSDRRPRYTAARHAAPRVEVRAYNLDNDQLAGEIQRGRLSLRLPILASAGDPIEVFYNARASARAACRGSSRGGVTGGYMRRELALPAARFGAVQAGQTVRSEMRRPSLER